MFIDPPKALESQRVPGLSSEKLGGGSEKLGGFFGEIWRSNCPKLGGNSEKLGGTYNVKQSEKSLRL